MARKSKTLEDSIAGKHPVSRRHWSGKKIVAGDV
jgi:hypothetical protein